MHLSCTFALAVVLVIQAPSARAQSQAQSMPTPLFTAGSSQGDTAASHTAAFGWFGRGVVAGGLAGPLGSWLVVSRAGRSSVSIPEERRAALSQREPEFASGYQAGFERRLRSERREYAFMGSLLGTAAFAFAILRLSHFVGRASQQGGDPPGGGF
jgi:hypothetical protein